MSDRYVPARIARVIDRLAHAHLCRDAGISPDPGRRMVATRKRVARLVSNPSDVRVFAYTLQHPQFGVWNLQWSPEQNKWVLIATQPDPSTGVPRMKVFSDNLIRLTTVLKPGSPMEARLMQTAEAVLERVVSEYNSDSQRLRRHASAVIVGDIFYSQWGYDQTNLDYYQVVKTTPASIVVRQIGKKMTRGRGEPTEYYVPVANQFKGPAMRKKLKDHQGRAYVDLNSNSSAYKWDGKEQSQTGAAYGH